MSDTLLTAKLSSGINDWPLMQTRIAKQAPFSPSAWVALCAELKAAFSWRFVGER